MSLLKGSREVPKNVRGKSGSLWKGIAGDVMGVSRGITLGFKGFVNGYPGGFNGYQEASGALHGISKAFQEASGGFRGIQGS